MPPFVSKAANAAAEAELPPKVLDLLAGENHYDGPKVSHVAVRTIKSCNVSGGGCT